VTLKLGSLYCRLLSYLRARLIAEYRRIVLAFRGEADDFGGDLRGAGIGLGDFKLGNHGVIGSGHRFHGLRIEVFILAEWQRCASPSPR